MEIINMLLTDIVPYEKNPRKNDEAVKYVAESMIDEIGAGMYKGEKISVSDRQ